MHDALNREDLVDKIRDLIYAIDVDGRLLRWNRRLEEVTGLSAQELERRPALEFFAEYDRERVAAAIGEAFRTGHAEVEADLIQADGSVRPYHYLGTPLRNSAGDIVGLTGVGRDISERREAEKRTAALLEMARDTSGTLDLSEVLDRVQRRTADVLPCDTVLILYRFPGEQDFRMISHLGLPPDDAIRLDGLTFPAAGPFGGRVAGGECAIVDDASSVDVSMATLTDVAMVVTPLRVRGRQLGTLVAGRGKGRPKFTPADAILCESIGHQLALAMEATELYHAQEDEARVSGALARVAQELMEGFGAPNLLDRLCKVTVEVLGCETSHTLLFSNEEDYVTTVAGHGYPPDIWESVKLLRLPRHWLEENGGVLDTLRQRRLAELSSSPLRRVASTLGIQSMMGMGLRRGDRVIGVHVACYLSGSQRFSPLQERIGAGIAQLASLALEHARTLEALEHASRVKSEFVATMSHELRSPLNVILGYHELLLEGAWGHLAPEQLVVLQRANQSASELLELITQTLDLSRLEAGRIAVDLSEISLADLVAEVEAETRSLWERPDLEAVWEVAPSLPVMCTDPLKLKVVLKNLVTNALKYTDSGTVSLVATHDDDGVEIRVSDTGAGISASTLPHIFDPFHQGEGSSKRGRGGVGLGLHIVRRLLELLGGTVSVESEIGRGSTFRVRLPLRPPVMSPGE